MPRFVVLLRGINVGKGNRLPMAELRATLESLGYTGVRTLLNSGNAVFAAPGRSPAAHAGAIRAALKERCGLELLVIVKSADELEAILAENALAAESADPARLLVAFTQDNSALRGLSDLASEARPPERFLVGEHAAFVLCPDGVLQSKAGSALLGKRGGATTTRNWRTVLELRELVQAT
jgi:uncharacterized protein (DUF1697 family)